MRIRRLLRHALHLGAAEEGRSRAAAPIVVTLVAGIVSGAVATGQAAAVGAAAPGQKTAVVDDPGSGRVLANQADVARALRALHLPGDSRQPRRASRAAHRTPLHRWVRPNYGPLSSPFGYRWGRLHAGIDLAGPYGSPIVAATDGCITYAGAESGYGEVLKMTDWDGTQTVYGHMSSFVRRSGCVKAGQVIARVGSEGDATGPHLHFEVRIGGAPVNPIPFLAKHGVYV
jgi:murein DD-endopeptidase MepM/ murein hydrolase activator NlpD